MSEQEFENYLVLLNQLLKLNKQQQEAIAGELRDHMEERLADLLQSGTDRHQAIRIALEEFGDASELAREFSHVVQNRKRSWMMRISAGTLALSVVGFAMLTAIWQNDAPPRMLSTARADESTTNGDELQIGEQDQGEPVPFIEATMVQSNNVRKALEKKVTFTCDDISLRDFVTELEKMLSIPIEVDNRALEDLAIDQDDGLPNHDLRGISAKAASDFMLAVHGLVSVPKNGYLWITSPEEAEAGVTTRIFPVWDLVRAPDSDALGGPDNSDVGVDYDSLIELVTSVSSPDSWEDVGGEGSIQGYRGLLVVSNVINVHQEIETLLRSIREVCGKSIQPTAKQQAKQRRAARFELAIAQDAEWRFEEEPLSNVVQYFSERLKIPVLLENRALEDLAINRDEPITSEINGIQFGDAMGIVLESVGLVYDFQDEFVLITSPEEAEGDIVSNVYNVSKLVNPSEMLNEHEVTKEIDSVIELVQSTISPDSWEEVGGEGSVQGLARHGVIVCANTNHVQQQVSILLSALELAAKTPNAAPADEVASQPKGLELRYYDLRQNAGLDSPQLISIITELISPKSWGSKPGEPFIRSFSGRLIIRHDHATHVKVVQMLEKLNLQYSESNLTPNGGTF